MEDPGLWAAVRLTLFITAMVVPMNLAFGVCAAMAVAKHDFKGKSFLITLIDLPFSVSPVIADLESTDHGSIYLEDDDASLAGARVT